MNNDDDEGGWPPQPQHKQKLIDKIMTVLYLDDSCGVIYGRIKCWFDHGSHNGRVGSVPMDYTDMVALSKDTTVLCLTDLPAL